MAGPEYDFFATGLRPAPAPAGPTGPTGPTMPTSPGGSSIVPGGPEVTRFGLPADAVAAPTGPHAAPGYAPEPVASGLAAGWDDGLPVPGGRAAARHAAQAAAPAAYDVRPGSVLAAGVIALVGAVVMIGLGLVGLFGYLALKSQIDEAFSGAALDPSLTGGEDFAAALLGAVLVGVVVLLVLGAAYAVLGGMVVAGRRWAAWTLLVLSALSLALQLWQGLTNGTLTELGSLTSISVALAVVLLLSVGDGGRWLRRS